MQRKYAEEEKAIEEKEKKALKARAEAEAGIFEDGKSTIHSGIHLPLVAASRALVAPRLYQSRACVESNQLRGFRVACCIANYMGWLQQARNWSSFPKRRNRHV